MSYRVIGTFDDSGMKRWTVGDPAITNYGSAGRASASKSGGPTPTRKDQVYTVKQKYVYGVTGPNYGSGSGSKTHVWNFNDATKRFQ